jgi:gliding motility-associated-like protein
VRTLSIILLIIFSSLVSRGQGLKLIRICNNGVNNAITWRQSSDTCIIIGTLNIWAQENSSALFYKIDSNIPIATIPYFHINANNPAIKDWHYKIEYSIKCNNDTITNFTKKLRVDDEKPDSTVLDSVSIDPINNTVLLGWSSNKTIDFSAYYLYNLDRADPRLQENYKDTFYVDNTPINPKTKSLQYDITSADSCDNRRDYGKYFHKTIWLSANIDTCQNKVTLSWTKYIGWEPKVHYIFKSVNGSAFQMIDSIVGNALSYIDKNVQTNEKLIYFVRAHSSTSSSSSNATNEISTSISKAPKNSKIEYITSSINKNLNIKIEQESGVSFKYYILERGMSIEDLDSTTSISNPTTPFEDALSNDSRRWYYRIISKNVCNQYSDTSAISSNIVLQKADDLSQIKMFWNNYFTWNNPIEKYTIYRASGDNINNATVFMALDETNDTVYDDTQSIESSVNCYYIMASETGTDSRSKSNTICYVATGEIFYPNAIVINGINNTFTFMGKSIELEKSSLQIYDRWGNQITHKVGIANGWDGTTHDNKLVSQGVYFFIAEIKRNDEIIKIKGTINVIN